VSHWPACRGMTCKSLLRWTTKFYVRFTLKLNDLGFLLTLSMNYDDFNSYYGRNSCIREELSNVKLIFRIFLYLYVD
jgi:hypothetical protein